MDVNDYNLCSICTNHNEVRKSEVDSCERLLGDPEFSDEYSVSVQFGLFQLFSRLTHQSGILQNKMVVVFQKNKFIVLKLDKPISTTALNLYLIIWQAVNHFFHRSTM